MYSSRFQSGPFRASVRSVRTTPVVLVPLFFAVGACTTTESEPDPASRRPSPDPVVLNGWPGPLRPFLTPRADRQESLRGSVDPAQPVVARCSLPEGQPVQWTRSRVRVTRPGQLAITSSTTVEAIRLPGLERVTGLSTQDGRRSPLTIDRAPGLELLARVGDRCLLQPGRAATVWSIPCPTRTIEIARSPEQTWWLEIACQSGEGWFEVDPSAYEIEHYPEELRRKPEPELPPPVFQPPPGFVPNGGPSSE